MTKNCVSSNDMHSNVLELRYKERLNALFHIHPPVGPTRPWGGDHIDRQSSLGITNSITNDDAIGINNYFKQTNFDGQIHAQMAEIQNL